MKELENVIKWVDALESGKLKQGKGKLGDHKDGFCCLGVACYVLGIDYNPTHGVSEDLPAHIGLLTDRGSLALGRYFYGTHNLTSVNDFTKAGFKRIAKLIKTHPDWMFREDVAEQIKQHYAQEK